MSTSELYVSTYDIALLSREQISSKNKSELHILAKSLGLTGYSKFNKSELVTLVFNASNIVRDSIINESLQRADVEKEKALRKELAIFEALESDNIINVSTINNINNRCKNDPNAPESVAKVLYDLCQKQNYAQITIAKEQSKRLKLILDDMSDELTYEFRDRLYKQWIECVRHIHIARRIEDEARVLSYATKAERTIDATESVIQWAMDNLHNDKRIYQQSIALSILSGRRMVEIHGDVSTYTKGNVGVIIKGLAKKSTDDATAEFIPLCDVDEFLDVINSYSKRGYSARQVNKNIGGTISKQYPIFLKDLNIEKYKDCRDFYAAVMYESFKFVGAREPKTFVKKCMGHDSEEATNYYRKFDVKAFEDSAFLDKLRAYMG
jgi:hypothetical protein